MGRAEVTDMSTAAGDGRVENFPSKSIGESETVHLELIPEGEVLVWRSCAASC